MTNLSDGELLDLLPSQMKNDPDMVALSHALKVGADLALGYELFTMTMNFIELLPEKIIDVMAVELRSPYYLDSMDLDVKRRIVANTLIWHTKAGTPSAMAELISIIFGEGRTVEWFNFTEPPYDPYTFDIYTNATMTEDIVERFLGIIDRVKNERSWLRRVVVERHIKGKEYVGAGAVSTPKELITNNVPPRECDISGNIHVGMAAVSCPAYHITNNMAAKRKAEIAADAGAGIATNSHMTITNHPKTKKELINDAKSGTGAISYPRLAI